MFNGDYYFGEPNDILFVDITRLMPTLCKFDLFLVIDHREPQISIVVIVLYIDLFLKYMAVSKRCFPGCKFLIKLKNGNDD